MKVLRFGADEPSLVLLELQASLIGLKEWCQVLSPEERTTIEMLGGTDGTCFPDFLRAKGGSLCPMRVGRERGGGRW